MTGAAMNHSPNCLFCKIAAGVIPSKKVYEDDEIFVFHDINPWAPVHFLMVPKEHIESLIFAQEQHSGLLGKMLLLAPKLAAQEGLRPASDGGFRVVINNGKEGGQEVYHLHIHVMGGPRPWKRG